MEIKIIKSRRRRKTISAKLKNNVLEVNAPWFLADDKIRDFTNRFIKKIQTRKKDREGDFLVNRAKYLLSKYFPRKTKKFTIFWSTRQTKIFGICNHRRKVIRISSRLKEVPNYVLDYVIIHELAHLFEPNHSPKFWEKVEKYPKMIRAKGFLEGFFWQENRETS